MWGLLESIIVGQELIHLSLVALTGVSAMSFLLLWWKLEKVLCQSKKKNES